MHMWVNTRLYDQCFFKDICRRLAEDIPMISSVTVDELSTLTECEVMLKSCCF